MKPYYENENGRLYHGDCLEIMPELDIKFDAIIADPPYGTTACKWDSIIDLNKLWGCLESVIDKKTTPVVLTSSQPFTTKLINSNINKFKYCWVWNKKKPGNIFLGKYQPMKIHEDIVVFYGNNYYPIMEKREFKKISKNYGSSGAFGEQNKDINNKGYNELFPKSIITISNATQKGKINPTQKPVKLLEYLIRTYTKENDLILDFSAGSGTTGIACEELNRKWVMIEKRERACEQVVKRIKKFNKQMRIF